MGDSPNVVNVCMLSKDLNLGDQVAFQHSTCCDSQRHGLCDQMGGQHRVETAMTLRPLPIQWDSNRRLSKQFDRFSPMLELVKTQIKCNNTSTLHSTVWVVQNQILNPYAR